MKWDARIALEAPEVLHSFELAQEYPPLQVAGEQVCFVAPVSVSGKAIADQRDEIHVMLHLSTRMHATCAKCLDDFVFLLEARVNETFLPAFDRDDPESPVYVRETIDFDPIIEQALLLELPMVLVCSPDCRGLCPHCGKNRNLVACDCHDEEVQESNGSTQE